MTGSEAVDLSAYREPLEVARGLVRLGVPLFTANSKGGGKFWLPTEWQRTVPDEGVVDRWRPGMALCAVTGVVFDVIDVDPQNGGLASFQEIHDLMPWSYGFVLTPSTGWHAWIKTLGLHKKPIRAGIDYQAGAPDGEGRGFVFIPPTERPSKVDPQGRYYAYTWRTPPADAPTVFATLRADTSGTPLRQLITTSSVNGSSPEGSSGYSDPDLEHLVVSGVSGGLIQDVALRDATWKMVSYGMPDEMIRRTWWEIVRATPETRPGESWSDVDLDRHLAGARAKLGQPMTVGERAALLPVADDVVVATDGDTDEPPLPPEMEQRIANEQLRLRVLREAREREDTYLANRAADNEVSREVIDGETFLFKEIIEVESYWGRGETVLWPKDEGLMIAGPQNIGKTVILQNLALRRVGIGDGDYLGHPMTINEDPEAIFLYLAMDRPAQARRSMRRMVADNPVDRGIVARHLRFWPGPLPINPARHDDPEALIRWATAYCGRTPAAIFCDSYKDLAVGLSKDEIGAALNLAVQAVIAAGCQWAGAHHHRKGDGQRPPRSLDDVYGSTWLTSGLGSVMMVWGEPSSMVVELSQLKAPADQVNPLHLMHDPTSGWLTVDDEETLDPLTVIRRRGAAGINASEFATEMFGGANSAQRGRARIQIERMVESRMVAEVPGGPVAGPRGGRPTVRYRLAEFDLPVSGPSAEGLRQMMGDGA